MEYENPKIPEGINTTDEHPLKGFAILLIATLLLLAVLSFVLAISGSWLAGRIPYATEAKIVEKFSGKFLESTDSDSENDSPKPSESENTTSQSSESEIETANPDSSVATVARQRRIEAYLQQQVDQLAALMDLPSEMQLNVNYIEDDVVNAFATLGGNLVFYRGLLESLPNENALSMLLAHEIAHVKLRHPIKSLGRGMAVTVGLSLVTGKTDNIKFLGNAGIYTILHFSRRMERASDHEALHAVYQRYGHLNGAKSLFSAIQAERDGDEPPEFFSSHPLDDDRLNAIGILAAKNGWSLDGQLTPIPEFWTEKGTE